jgi:hypothetical protein
VIRVISLLMAVLVAFALWVPAMAQEPGNVTQAGAILLTGDRNSAPGTLVGNTGGAFRYYEFDYAGPNAPVIIELSFYPGHPTTGKERFGFNIYGPASFSASGLPSEDTKVKYTLASPVPGRFLIQVYNYTDALSVDFTLWVEGLAAGTVQVARGNETPEQAIQVRPTYTVIGGQITGDPAGRFNFYSLDYPGGDRTMTIRLTYTPAYSFSGQPIGFNLYRGEDLIGQSSEIGRDDSSVTVNLDFNARAAGTYGLQVFSYWAGATVNYSISATGLAPGAPRVSGNTTPGQAVTLTGTAGASATLGGQRAGAFNFYNVGYPGDDKETTVVVTFRTPGGSQASALGFNVYRGSEHVADVQSIEDTVGTYAAIWTRKSTDSDNFSIQVYNYTDGVPAEYTIYVIGAR